MRSVAIARDFHPFPGGRYRRHGEGNGEDFRQDHLIPFLELGEKFEVLLDHASGFPASFLEEAFGGLVRAGYRADQLRDLMVIRATREENSVYCDEAWQYIADEDNRRAAS